MVRGAFGDIDLLLAGITDCNKHTIDIHCPLFNESPTNISLFPLNFSHISVTFHLQNKPKNMEKQINLLPIEKNSKIPINYIPYILQYISKAGHLLWTYTKFSNKFQFYESQTS